MRVGDKLEVRAVARMEYTHWEYGVSVVGYRSLVRTKLKQPARAYLCGVVSRARGVTDHEGFRATNYVKLLELRTGPLERAFLAHPDDVSPLGSSALVPVVSWSEYCSEVWDSAYGPRADYQLLEAR